MATHPITRIDNQLEDIYRLYYNYCKVNDKGKTPAMRLGLAKGPVELEKTFSLDKYTKAIFVARPGQTRSTLGEWLATIVAF